MTELAEKVKNAKIELLEDLIKSDMFNAIQKEYLKYRLERIKNNEEDRQMIKDSGERRKFETGAVRDIQSGKGRCDLMPLDVIAEYLISDGESDKVLKRIYQFQQTLDIQYLLIAIDAFNDKHWKDNKTMILEVAKHFEEGALKYGENNWQKGIPAHCYVDSAVRHYLKWCRGDNDEPHDRAFVWNILCLIWTVEHVPEMNDIKGEKDNVQSY